jgi:MFS family permease
VFALCFGVADAFFFPAEISIIPQLVDKDCLQAGNSLIQAVAQVSQIGGPVLAGLVIALLGAGQTTGSAPDVYGIGIAFVIDALTFVASVITLWMIRPPRAVAAGQAPAPAGQPGLLSSIGEGIGYVWRRAALRWVFLLTGAIDFLAVGPVLVGIPVLADTRLPEGALAFGIAMSAWGGGSLLGIIAAGVLPKVPPQRQGSLVMLLVGSFGLDLLVMGLLPSTPVVALAAFVMGAAGGYINIVYITWLQSRVPVSMLGRVMSMLMFASVGLIPVSQALCGALGKVSITGVFVGAGALLPLLAARALLVPEVRHMGSEETMTTEAAGTPA